MKKERLLTVGSAWYVLEFDHVKVPFIRLSGKWLEAAGFHVGDIVNVEHCHDRLIIKKVNGIKQSKENFPNKISPSKKRLMKTLGKRKCDAKH